MLLEEDAGQDCASAGDSQRPYEWHVKERMA